MGRENGFGRISPLESASNRNGKSELEKCAVLIDNVLNQKKQEILNGKSAVGADFSSIKISSSDIPQEILPNNSKDMVVLQNDMNLANKELEEIWKEYQEKNKPEPKLEQKPEAELKLRQKSVAETESNTNQGLETVSIPIRTINIELMKKVLEERKKRDAQKRVNGDEKKGLVREQDFNTDKKIDHKGFVAKLKDKIFGTGKKEKKEIFGKDLKEMAEVLKADDPRKKAKEKREAEEAEKKVEEERMRLEEEKKNTEKEMEEKKKAVADGAAQESKIPVIAEQGNVDSNKNKNTSPFAETAPEETQAPVAEEKPVAETAQVKIESAKPVEQNDFEGKVFDIVHHIFAGEQATGLNKEDEHLLGLARKYGYIINIGNLFVKEKKDAQIAEDEMEKEVRDFCAENVERANKKSKAKNKEAIFELVKKIAKGGELSGQEQEKPKDKFEKDKQKLKKTKEEKKKEDSKPEKPKEKIPEVPEMPKAPSIEAGSDKSDDAEKIKIKPKSLPDDYENNDNAKFGDLVKKIETDRKDYLEMDYKKKKAFNSVYKFFGHMFRHKNNQNLENDPEVAYMRAHYDNSLLEYKKAILKDANENGVSQEKLTEIVAFFETEAKLNLSEAHNDVKAEHLDGRVKQWMIDGTKWYRELPFAKKLLVGTACAGIISGGVYAGGAAAVAVGAGAFAKRFFLSVATGTGISLGLEKRTEIKREAEVSLKKDIAAKKMEEMTPEEMFDFLNAQIDKTIYDENDELNKIKNEKLKNLGLAIALGSAGTIAGSIVDTDMLKSGFGWVVNQFKEMFEIEQIDGVVNGSKDSGLAKILMNGNVTDEFEESAKEVAETFKIETLRVEKGDSLEKILIEYIKNHKSEIYNHHPELKNFDAGQIAHRVALDFAHEHSDKFPSGPPSLIHPGAEIIFNPETLEIENIQNDPGLGYLPEEIESGSVNNVEVSAENVEGVIDGDSAPIEQAIIDDDVRTSGTGLDESEMEAFNAQREEEHSYFVRKFSENPDFFKQFKERLAAVRGDICEGDSKIFNQINKLNISKNQNEIMVKLGEKGKKVLGEFLKDVPCNKVESFDQWARRAVRISMESQK
ncbi:MAG: hypothetical protein ACD_11C00103G0049 [uncultured bacterium]|nr:MAG: hypothetical protein ACD_11C00103G0049 [uncultured bacterium]HBR71213.1 hypothetical protein [Candidatus Moranbacteria bacterium]